MLSPSPQNLWIFRPLTQWGEASGNSWSYKYFLIPWILHVTQRLLIENVTGTLITPIMQIWLGTAEKKAQEEETLTILVQMLSNENENSDQSVMLQTLRSQSFSLTSKTSPFASVLCYKGPQHVVDCEGIIHSIVIHGFRVIVLFSLLPLCYRNTKRNFWMLCCRWFVVEYMYSLIKRYINYNNVLVIVGDLNWRHCWCTCWRLLQIGDVVNKKCH